MLFPRALIREFGFCRVAFLWWVQSDFAALDLDSVSETPQTSGDSDGGLTVRLGEWWSQRPLSGYYHIIVGVAGYVLPPLSMLAILIAMQAATGVAGFGLLDMAVLTIVVLLTHQWANEQYQKGKRIVARARDAAAVDLTRPFVLYLRGFVDDYVASATLGEPTFFMHGFANLVRFPLTEEEHLARALGTFGQVVALGRPGEDMPILGAKRIYVDEPSWQDAVRKLAREARFVVLRLSRATGVIWELQILLRELPREKVAILVSEHDSTPGRQLIVPVDHLAWRALESEVGRQLSFPDAFPSSPKLGTLRGLVFFDASGEPIVHALTKRDVDRRLSRYPLADALRDVFVPLLARVGVRGSRVMWVRRSVAFAADYAVTLGLVGLATAFTMDGPHTWIPWLLGAGYWPAWELLFRRTPGKMLTRLRISSVASYSFPLQIVVRNSAKLAMVFVVGVLPAGAFAVLAGVCLTAYRWGALPHDLASGTRVVGKSPVEQPAEEFKPNGSGPLVLRL